jgi:glycosyltransferase involved in cell wall biosynthesis
MRETSGGAAIFADDGDFTKALAQALELNGPRRAELAEAGRRNAARFCVKRMAQAYRALYESVIQ